MAIKTNIELINALYDLLNNYKTVYMWGVFGSIVTEKLIQQKSAQYPAWYTLPRVQKFYSLVGKNYFGFDCVNTIKGLLWGWSGDRTHANGGAQYAANGVLETNADGMIAKCSGVSGLFQNIVPGEVVWMSGHIGTYVGDGKVIECTDAWDGCVQMTALAGTEAARTHKVHKWLKHGKLPYIQYIEEAGEVYSQMKIQISDAPVKEIPSVLKDDYNHPQFRPLMDMLGYDIEYDKESKVTTITPKKAG